MTDPTKKPDLSMTREEKIGATVVVTFVVVVVVMRIVLEIVQ